MPAFGRGLMQGGGLWAGVRKPPREETAGRKGAGARGADLWGFCDWLDGGRRLRGRGLAADEGGGGVRARRIDVGWRIVAVKRREIGRIDRLRRGGDLAGETCRRGMMVDVRADRVGGQDESIPAGSAVKLRG